MRRDIGYQRGFTLVEVVVGITLMMIVLSGMVSLFSGSLRIWTVEKNNTSLEQTARIAVDTVVREIRYAQSINLNNPHSLTIRQLNGEITTFQLGSDLHSNTLYMIIDKWNAIPAGGCSTNPITENIVTTLVFTPYPQTATIQAIIITLEVTDPRTGKKQRIHTAGYPLNSHKIFNQEAG